MKLSDALVKSIKKHEGKRLKSYDDVGHRSVGYGYNMTSNPSQAKKDFAKVGADYEAVKSGKGSITNEQAEALLKFSLSTAEKDARNFVDNFDKHPQEVQDALIEMSYQLGGPTLRTFKNTKKAFDKGDYEKAAEGMLSSKWAKQTPGRVKSLANKVESATNEPSPVLDMPEPEEDTPQEVPDMAGFDTPSDAFSPILSMEPDARDMGPTVPEATTNEYTVQKGDTLSKIAQREGLDWKELAKMNNLDNPDLIMPGQKIKLGGAGV